MKHFFLSTLVICMTCTSVYANNTYQSEYLLSYNKQDSDNGSEINNIAIGYTYYLSPIETKNHPLREAAFLEMASGVSINYSSDVQSGTAVNSNIDFMEATFHYIFKDNQIPISLSAEYSNENFSFDGISFEYDEDTTGLGIGAYVLKDTLISLFYSESEAAFSSSRSSEIDAIDVEVKHVIEMDNDTAFSISGNIMKSNATIISSSLGKSPNTRSTIYQLNGTYYLNRNIGIGIRLAQSKNNRNSSENKGVEMFADIFLSNNYSLRFGIGKNTASGRSVPSLDADEDTMSITFFGRI